MRIKCYEYGPRGQCHKTFFVATYKGVKEARVVVPVRPFQPSLIFAGKAGAYPSRAPFSDFKIFTKTA